MHRHKFICSMSPTCTCNYWIYRSVVHEVDAELFTYNTQPTTNLCSCMYSKISRKHSFYSQSNQLYLTWSLVDTLPPTPAHTFTKQTYTILGVGWACKLIIIMLDLTFSADAMFISKNLLSNRNSADPQNIIKYSPAHFFSFNGGLYLNRSSALCSGVFMQVCKVSLMM